MERDDDIGPAPNEADDTFMAQIRQKFSPVRASFTRKAKAKSIDRTSDGRSARATGRTEQFNFRSSEGLKARVVKAAAAQGITVAEWMERATERALDGQGE